MLLALDVGNTNITGAVFEGDVLQGRWQMATRRRQAEDERWEDVVSGLAGAGVRPEAIGGAVIAAVVPAVGRSLVRMLRNRLGLRPLVVGPGVKTGLVFAYDEPAELGADRIADAAAAFHLHGGPVIVVDCGTAITLCAVTAEGRYLGGVIAPGLRMAARSLEREADLLPVVELRLPPAVIARNTADAIRSGLMYGLAHLVDGLVDRMRAELGTEAKVVATGGGVDLIASLWRSVDSVDTDLTLKGLELIYRLNRKEG